MSQPHNLQPEELSLEDLQPAAPLTAVPTRTTDPAPTHPDATEAPMATPTPTPPSTKPVRQATPTTAAATDTTPSGAGESSVVVGADVMGMLAAVARPRLASVGGSGKHTVPATARYAGELTDGALALRLQAITRLGVVSAPRHLSSSAAVAPAQEEHGDAGGEEEPAGAEAAGGGAAKEGVKLSVVPAVGGVSRSVAAPGQPDGARASLTTSAATGTAPGLPEVRVWGARLAQAVSEVLAGDRPISQLVRFTDDVVFMELNRRVRMLGMNSTAGMRGAKEKSTVRSVRVFMPEPRIAEVAAHVRHGQRSRAVAFRLEVRRNRWVCTALELG